MAKYKLRVKDGYVFLRNGNIARDTVVDENDPDFAKQKYKFEATPVDEAVAAATVQAQVATALAAELGDVSKLKRADLVDLFTRIAGKAPPEEIKAPELKQVLELVKSGMGADEALVEVCGEPAPSKE